ncbi:MAG: DUF2321 domain-containing protein [Candidatus Nealsonbacteria bacterium]
MGHYETMQVCRRGHQITDHYNSSPKFRQEFCDKCGAKTIYRCPKCGVPIRGHYIIEGFVDLTSTPVPLNCHNCGANYPWSLRFRLLGFLELLVSPIKFLIEAFSKIFK